MEIRRQHPHWRHLWLPVLAFVMTAASCSPEQGQTRPLDAAFIRLSAWEVAELPLAVHFESPMGGENGSLVYNAQRFRLNRHLGDDLNGIGGWNSDLGDPVYASGTGKVIYAGNPSPGWGNMVILAHRVREGGKEVVYQTIYAHLDAIKAETGQTIPRGQHLGTVGTADGRYLAHLHFEVRKSLSVYPGIGYSDAPLDRVSPEAFLKEHGMNMDTLRAPFSRVPEQK